MSYTDKYRPPTLDQVAGNPVIVAGLKAELAKSPEDRKHFFIFDGGGGCGKTTLAMILSESLNATPLDIITMNGAEFGKQDGKDLAAKFQYRPMGGECSVYIINEAHKATRDFHTVLLTTLETLPSHVYVIYTASLPLALWPIPANEKTPVQRRAFYASLQPMSPKHMGPYLCGILEKEGISIPDEHLDLVIEAGDGSPGMALQMLEQVLPCKDVNEVKEALAGAAMGEDSAETKELCQALLNNTQYPSVMKILGKMRKIAPETIRHGVLGYCAAVAMGGSQRAGDICRVFSPNTFDSGMGGIVGYIRVLYRN